MTPQELAGDLMAQLCPDAMLSAVVIVAEVIAPGEPATAYVLWDDSASAWTHEGMARMAVRRIEARTVATPGGS